MEQNMLYFLSTSSCGSFLHCLSLSTGLPFRVMNLTENSKHEGYYRIRNFIGPSVALPPENINTRLRHPRTNCNRPMYFNYSKIGVRFPAGAGMFLFATTVWLTLEPTQSPIKSEGVGGMQLKLQMINNLHLMLKVWLFGAWPLLCHAKRWHRFKLGDLLIFHSLIPEHFVLVQILDKIKNFKG